MMSPLLKSLKQFKHSVFFLVILLLFFAAAVYVGNFYLGEKISAVVERPLIVIPLYQDISKELGNLREYLQSSGENQEQKINKSLQYIHQKTLFLIQNNEAQQSPLQSWLEKFSAFRKKLKGASREELLKELDLRTKILKSLSTGVVDDLGYNIESFRNLMDLFGLLIVMSILGIMILSITVSYITVKNLKTVVEQEDEDEQEDSVPPPLPT